MSDETQAALQAHRDACQLSILAELKKQTQLLIMIAALLDRDGVIGESISKGKIQE